MGRVSEAVTADRTGTSTDRPAEIGGALESIFDRHRKDGSADPLSLGDVEAVRDLASLQRLASVGQDMVATMQQRVLPQSMRTARRISAVLSRLEKAGTVSDLLRGAPGEFGIAAEFDRVLISTVDGSHWAPLSWWARDSKRPQDRAIAATLQGSRLALSGGMVEAEVVRRRSTAHVRDMNANLRPWAPFADVAESASYIAAPIMVFDRVAALIHADAGVSERGLGDIDVTLVTQFADALGVLMEGLERRRRFDAQTLKLQEALTAAAAAVTGVITGPTQIRTTARSGPSDGVSPDPRAGVGQTFHQDRLTARERDVFDLLVGGSTNGQIADRLTVSETTVKSHVQHILRKLGASNRSQVIAQYLQASNRGGAR